MPEFRRLLPAVLMAIGIALVQSAERQQVVQLPRPLRTMPLELTGVRGDERVVSEQEREVAGVSDYVFRIFRKDSVNAFSVYVGYYESQATGKTIHSPRNCLPGAGWQTVEAGTRELAMGQSPVKVNRYILANGSAQALVYYWYQGRGRVAHSEYAVKWDLLRDAATIGRTEEALVRIMVPIQPSRASTGEDWRRRVAEAEALATTVATELLPHVAAVLPAWAATI
jgi:EpsI family protein